MGNGETVVKVCIVGGFGKTGERQKYMYPANKFYKHSWHVCYVLFSSFQPAESLLHCRLLILLPFSHAPEPLQRTRLLSNPIPYSELSDMKTMLEWEPGRFQLQSYLALRSCFGTQLSRNPFCKRCFVNALKTVDLRMRITWHRSALSTSAAAQTCHLTPVLTARRRMWTKILLLRSLTWRMKKIWLLVLQREKVKKRVLLKPWRKRRGLPTMFGWVACL